MKDFLLDYPLYYKRRKTKTVWVGEVPIGSQHPFVIQSMLTTHTYHPEACLKEIRSLCKVGCSIIRLAIPSRRDLEGMVEIRRLMREEGITTPLSADIHFAPHLALDACDFFEKIRINPGNFSDRSKNSSARSHLPFDFQEGKERFRDRITPLVKKLKKQKKALRIGVNQGSLSARMLQAFGDSPLGMVESALESIELFREQDFHSIVVSLKSSNPLIVQKAYRLFCKRDRWDTPLHLGVTEAGNETAGRVKSLVGIAPLLLDGIGDTIRISLTEDSSNEVIFAKKFLNYFENNIKPKTIKKSCQKKNYWRDLVDYRVENEPLYIQGVKLAEASNVKVGRPKSLKIPEEDFFQTDFFYSLQGEDFFFEQEKKPLFLLKNFQQKLVPQKNYAAFLLDENISVRQAREIYQYHKKFSLPLGAMLPPKTANDDYSLELKYACLLGEGLLDFLLLHPKTTLMQLKRLSFLLQATKTKISRTEYIACPSCGRTLFDLQEVTEKIKKRTSHLKGVKIGIMGCMVNGPGEMADADFGYVGSVSGKVDLYLGHKKIRRAIPEELAVDSLISLMKEEGKWTEPPLKDKVK